MSQVGIFFSSKDTHVGLQLQFCYPKSLKYQADILKVLFSDVWNNQNVIQVLCTKHWFLVTPANTISIMQALKCSRCIALARKVLLWTHISLNEWWRQFSPWLQGPLSPASSRKPNPVLWSNELLPGHQGYHQYGGESEHLVWWSNLASDSQHKI